MVDTCTGCRTTTTAILCPLLPFFLTVEQLDPKLPLVGRSTLIFLKCRTRLFLFSLFTNYFTHALYINNCYKINLLKKYFVVMIRERKHYTKFHLIGNKYETKRFLTNAMFMFSRWWKSMYEMTFPCKMS